MQERKILGIIIIIISILIAWYVIYITTQPDYTRNLIKYDEHYNNARNQTLKEIDLNTTILQKITIISFNCEKSSLYGTWINTCKNDLSKELLEKE